MATGQLPVRIAVSFENSDASARPCIEVISFIALPRFYMVGTGGSAVVDDWRDRCRLVLCDKWDEKDVKPVVTSAGLTKTMAPRDEKTTTESFIERPESDVHDFYRNFCAAVRGEAEMIVTHKQLMRVMRVMEASFESDAKCAPVKFDDNF